jgi:hypothetical protein
LIRFGEKQNERNRYNFWMIIDKNDKVVNPEELVTTNDPIKFKHQLLIIDRVAKSAAAALCECPCVGGLLKLAMGSKIV